MELKIEVQGLDEAISRLDRISRGARQQLRSAMLSSVRDVQRTAREKHKFVTRSGEAERSIESNVQFSGDTWVGTVGTTRKVTIYLHQGTPKHVITPKRKLALRWTAGGKFVLRNGFIIREPNGTPLSSMQPTPINGKSSAGLKMLSDGFLRR